MKKLFIFITVSLIIASFNISSEDKIAFSYSKIQSFDSTIRFKGNLENLTSDTLYILTTGCNGLAQQVHFNPECFDYVAVYHCNVDQPIIKVVEPKQIINFHFNLKAKQCFSIDSSSFEIDIYLVENELDLKKFNRSDIHFRKDKTFVLGKFEIN
jgi:hypothetical protein